MHTKTPHDNHIDSKIDKLTDTDAIIEHTRRWVERVVIGLNLCPFARTPLEKGRIRFVVSTAEDAEGLLTELHQELLQLRRQPTAELETTLLIHPYVLQDFLDYNDFLDFADALLDQGGYRGEFQIASMHPDYQFDGIGAGDAENYTNRSPYPMLHLLREEVLEQALDSYPNPEAIPERNIQTLERLGTEHMQRLLAGCLGKENP